MIRIDEMVLRIPGLNEQEGHALGQMVAQRLAGRLAEDTIARHLDAVNIQLTMLPGMTHLQLADEITEQILRQMNLTLLGK